MYENGKKENGKRTQKMHAIRVASFFIFFHNSFVHHFTKMGDTVQTILERMVPELEDLQKRGLFTEVSNIYGVYTVKKYPCLKTFTRSGEFSYSLFPRTQFIIYVICSVSPLPLVCIISYRVYLS